MHAAQVLGIYDPELASRGALISATSLPFECWAGSLAALSESTVHLDPGNQTGTY